MMKLLEETLRHLWHEWLNWISATSRSYVVQTPTALIQTQLMGLRVHIILNQLDNSLILYFHAISKLSLLSFLTPFDRFKAFGINVKVKTHI